MTDGIRVCKRSDFEQITDLYRSTFTDSPASQSPSLQQYLEQVYLDNPWVSDEITSLVSEKSGRINGYLGVIPRTLQFQGSPVTMAVSSALMVAPGEAGHRNPLVGVALLRRFLGGPQDLSLTDTANDVTCKIWTASGGSIAHPYCYTWMRPLKPLSACAETFLDAGVTQSVLRPLLSCGDAVLRRIPPIKPSPVDCEAVEISSEELLALQNQVPKRAIMPVGDQKSLDWLLDMAGQSETEGPLAKCVVRSGTGQDLGWFVYYRSRNATGRVLQLVSLGNSYEAVLDCLLHDASRNGLAALWGRTEPGKNSVLASRHCLFKGVPWMLIHSANCQLIDSFLQADALFTGFEGEHWMKTNA